MPRPAYGDGPWGEAIRYWLAARKLRQADLVRLIRELNAKDTITPNTISNATRGFPTTTRVLEKIARALNVPIDAVLVSPERKAANEERKRLVAEITEKVLREMDARQGESIGTEEERAIEILQRKIEADAAQATSRHATLARPSTPPRINKRAKK